MKLLTSPILAIFTVMAIVLVVFLVRGTVSMVVIYVTGFTFTLGTIIYMSYHRWNKDKPGYKSNIEGHNENMKI